MGEAAGLDDEVAGSGLEDVVTPRRAAPALQNTSVLVLVVVGVQRRAQGTRRQRVLDQAERAAGRLTVDDETDAQGE